MKTYLVTGAAGFIGANYIKYILGKHSDLRVVVLDALTYAGNLGTIVSDIDNDRCIFVKGDVCDRSMAEELFAQYKFDYVVNFAAESHVDRSIENPQLFLTTNILGTQNLLDAARRAWVAGKDTQGYPLCVKVYDFIRYRPMKCMVRWEPMAILQKIPLFALTVRIVLRKQVLIWWLWHIMTRTRCRSQFHAVLIIMVLFISPRN